MTAFNKGDRIIFVENDHYFGVEMPKGTRATYDDDGAAERAPWVRLDTGERVLTLRDRIAHAEPETPADVDMWAAKDALQAEVAAEVFQTPEPEPAVPEAQFGTAEVEPYGRLRGFLVYSATGRTFLAPLPGGGYTVISGEYVDDLAFTPDAPPYLVEWATEVDTLGTKEIWDSEAEAREMADRYGQRLFRVEWTEVPR